MLVMFEKGDLKEKSYFLPPFENVLIVDAMELCLFKIKSALCKQP